MLYGYYVSISEQFHSREYDPYKEKTTLYGTPADVSWFVYVAVLDHQMMAHLHVRVREY
jgi:hypothetical protein